MPNDYDEFAVNIPAHLSLRQRRKLYLEHRWYELCRDIGIVALLVGSALIAGGFTNV